MKNFFKESPVLFSMGIVFLLLLFFVPFNKLKFTNQNALDRKKPDLQQENISPSSVDESSQENENEENKNASTISKAVDAKIVINPSDCDNECEKFKKDEELEYCRQACGIETYYDYSESEEDSSNNEDEKETSSDCDEEKELQRDYCLKDNAVDESNYEMCEKISDTGIKKACQNRITEDLLEEQNNSNDL